MNVRGRLVSVVLWVIAVTNSSTLSVAQAPATKDAGGLITLIEAVDVPAREGGLLEELAVEPGSYVEVQQFLARLDDKQELHNLRMARRQYEISKMLSESNADIEFAKLSERVAYLEFERAKEVNALVSKATTATDLDKLRFDWERARLQIQQAQISQRRNQLEAEIRGEEVESAQLAVSRRQVLAPMSGQIVEVYRQAGEWVDPGEPIVRLVRLDRLRIKRYISAAEFLPSELKDLPAVAEVTLARGRRESFPGRVVFVNPLEEDDGNFAVWIDLENRQENGAWLLMPGKWADVHIGGRDRRNH